MKKTFLIFALILCLSGCATKEDNKTVDTNLQELLNEKEYTIIDVRTKAEYEESHIKDAINIPYDEIDESIDLDKDKNIFVYCKSGQRSSVAYKKLSELGYGVYDLGAFAQIDLPKE